MRQRLRRHRSADTRRTRGDLQIAFDREVLAYMVGELSRDQSVEEGGKYVGYLLHEGDPALQRVGLEDWTALVVVDYLPSGPRAIRTAVELMPDGEYQEDLFRRIEVRDAAIEHVGTWHSHHCNGLERLSPRDVEGYFRTVNKAAYNLDYFVASLVKRVPRGPEEVDWIDHFLFVRGAREYHQITDEVRIVRWQSTFMDLTGHRVDDGIVGARVTVDHVDAATVERRQPTCWYESDTGRGVLASDKRLFDETFGGAVTATRRGAKIALVGRTEGGSVAVTYPQAADDDQMSINVALRETTVLRMDFALRHRQTAFVAAFAALGERFEPTD